MASLRMGRNDCARVTVTSRGGLVPCTRLPKRCTLLDKEGAVRTGDPVHRNIFKLLSYSTEVEGGLKSVKPPAAGPRACGSDEVLV